MTSDFVEILHNLSIKILFHTFYNNGLKQIKMEIALNLIEYK